MDGLLDMLLVPRTELDELLPRDGMVYAPRYDELDEPLTPVLIAGPRDELLELMFEAAWLDPRYPAELDGREFGRYT